MSHTLDFETVVQDAEALKRALLRMEVPESLIEIHDSPVRLNTYHKEENKIAHVVVRRKLNEHYSSDIGWERNDEGLFVGHIDEYHYCGEPTPPWYDAAWQKKLYTYYNVEATKIAFERQGMEYTESQDKQGRIQLRAKFKAAPVKANKIKIHTTR